jgi:Tfp pilus assembly protein PilF
LNRAIELNPKLALVYKNRAVVYQYLGQSEKAQSDLETAAKLGN